ADGQHVASGTADGAINVWDLATSSTRQVLRGHKGAVVTVAFSSNLLASGGSDNTIRLWEMSTGREMRSIVAYVDAAWVSSLGFSPDGALLASAAFGTYGPSERAIKIWDVATGRERQAIRSDLTVKGIALSPDGQLLASAGQFSLQIWEIKSGREVQRLDVEA